MKKLTFKKRTSTMLDEEIRSLLEAMKDMDPNTDEYEKAADNLSTLYNLKTDEGVENKKLFVDVLKAGIGFAGTVAFYTVYKKYIDKGFQFEKEGTFTSDSFRSFMPKFKLPH